MEISLQVNTNYLNHDFEQRHVSVKINVENHLSQYMIRAEL